MKMQLVAIKDTAAQAFMQPVFCHATGVALREFADAVNSGDHQFAKHPEDFEMYFLGEFDDSDASFALPKSPQLLSRALDLKVVKS